MATSGTYYLNAPTFSEATSIYTDQAQTTFAPDGWYSIGGLVRRQISGVLQASQGCPRVCNTNCNINVTESLEPGVYYIDVDTGSLPDDTGAIVVEFTTNLGPIGVSVSYDGESYNDITSSVYGSLQSSNPAMPTFVGDVDDSCTLTGETFVLDVYEYNSGAFTSTGTTESISVTAGDNLTTANNPGLMIIVAPKPAVLLNNTARVKIVVPCSRPLTDVNVYVNCPEDLEEFSSSVKSATSAGACDLPENEAFYRMDISSSPGQMRVNDRVYIDKYGRTKLSDEFGAGYYKASGMDESYDWFRIDSKSVVVELGNC